MTDFLLYCTFFFFKYNHYWKICFFSPKVGRTDYDADLFTNVFICSDTLYHGLSHTERKFSIWHKYLKK